MHSTNPFQNLEVNTIRERSRMAVSKRAEQGIHPCGPAPYGYRRNRSAPGELVVHEDEAQVIRLVFDVAAEVPCLWAVAHKLHAQGVLSRGKAATPKTIERVLRSPAVAGLVRVPGTDVLLEAQFPAVIGREVFERVAAMMPE